jgi:hypothetical protein
LGKGRFTYDLSWLRICSLILENSIFQSFFAAVPALVSVAEATRIGKEKALGEGLTGASARTGHTR